METIVGIDLGTTNSEIAVVIDGKIQVIPIDSDPIMPSVVGIDAEGKLIVGKTAKNQMVSAPESTIMSVKRTMGQDTRHILAGREFSPEEISSRILNELKIGAEKFLGHPVTKAVITVPAYFSDRQRAATRDAGILAGLDVVRIINEPTAAALAYDEGSSGDRRILVYDLGGGTFDVSIVIVENGVVEVKSTHGDTHLGGDDFDNLLIDYAAEEIGVDLSNDLRARRRLWKAVEKAKRELSDAPFARIQEEFITPDKHADFEISRDTYEEMITPLVRKTLDSVHQCLREANYLPKAIDKILLVGGATRTPLIQKMLTDEMGIIPRFEINPDLIVSMGAALQGASIGGAPTHSILVDITPYSFGTGVIGEYQGAMHPGVYAPVIHRNSALPQKKSEVFYTHFDEQETVDLSVYQGEKPLAEDNILIGEFHVSGLSRVPAGNPIVLNLDLDLNGLLKVTAMEKKTGLVKSVVMDTKNVKNRIDLAAAKRSLNESFADGSGSDNGLDEDAGSIESPGVGGRDESLLKRAKELRIRAEKIIKSANKEDSAEIGLLLEKSSAAISGSEWKTLDECNESLSDMLFYLED